MGPLAVSSRPSSFEFVALRAFMMRSFLMDPLDSCHRPSWIVDFAHAAMFGYEAVHGFCSAISNLFLLFCTCTIGIVVALRCTCNLLFAVSSMAAWGFSSRHFKLCGGVLWLCGTLSSASISEDVFDAIAARNAALRGVQTNNPAVRFHRDWQQLHFISGLPLFLGAYGERWEFYVVHGGPDTLSPDQATLDLTPSLPGFSVCSFIHTIWPAVRTMEWRAVEVHASAQRDADQYGSAVLPRRNRHILIFSKQDMIQQPSYEPVMVEIRWPSADGVRSVTAFGHWMPLLTTVPNFLARLGFLRACTLSHRCSIYHNSRYVRGVQMSIVDGDFLVLEGFVIDIPTDSDDDIRPHPQPVRQPRAETSSDTSPDSADTEMVSSTSLDSDDASLPPDLTVTIFRPRGPLGRPLYPIRERARGFHRPCLEQWPDLGGKGWTSFRVHPSYNLAFPQHEIAEHYVIRDPTEAGPRMTVLVMVSAPRTLYLQAMSMSSPTSRLQILNAVGLQAMVPSTLQKLHYVHQ